MVRGESTVGEGVRDGALTLVSGVNVRDLPIGPTEAFVLSRVEGSITKAELVTASGLSAEELETIVARLILLGALEFVERQSMVAPVAASAHRSGAHSILLSDRSESVSELTAEQQQLLLDLDRRSTSLDHYQLLGIEPSADAKTLRAAYYELVRIYHPDRYFGRKLGELEGPLVRAFGKFSEAYEVLHRPESRAEYDRYLGALRRTVDFDRYLHDARRPSTVPASNPPASHPPAVSAPASHSPVASASAGVATPNPPESFGTPSVPPQRDARASENPRQASSVPPQDSDARRRALARKLGHSSLPPSSSSSQSVPAVSDAVRAAEELRRRYDQRMAHVREDQIKHYVALSSEAAGHNDLVGAANLLRIACSLAPDNLELAGDLADLEQRMTASLWESYLDRAKYAAAEGNYAEAAESYERAALGQPNASLFERAAHYTLEANGDLHKASKLAKQAVALAPNSAKCRLTLARVYFAASLHESALAELERARAIEPNQPILKEWIERVKRGE